MLYPDASDRRDAGSGRRIALHPCSRTAGAAKRTVALLEQTAFLNWFADRFEEGFYGIDLSGLCCGGDG